MNILLTALCFVSLIGCFLAYTRSQRMADDASDSNDRCDTIATKLFAERARVTVLERELEALRRELRKLSGKFYARERELAEALESQAEYDAIGGDADLPSPDGPAPFCENYGSAQLLGPTSEAAKCECRYCLEMRHRRELARRELVPKTVRGQAELAKLNAAKP